MREILFGKYIFTLDIPFNFIAVRCVISNELEILISQPAHTTAYEGYIIRSYVNSDDLNISSQRTVRNFKGKYVKKLIILAF